jgi:hypothetical protein
MSDHAELPEDLETETLSQMPYGEPRWTLPWAMWADAQRRLWLRSGYPAFTDRGSTATMRVRVDRDESDHGRRYVVWPDRQYRYSPGGGSSDGTDLPVAELGAL